MTYLGKQSRIMLLSKELGKVPPELRPAFGEAVNAGKKRLQEALTERKASMGTAGRRSKNAIDVTLPGIRKGVGRRHPLMQTMEAVKTVLQGMGFRYDDYPEVETEYHNFDSLNTPKWHPSRDMHDSFYTKAGGVLRTHTTAFQVRAMRHQKDSADPRDDVRAVLPARRDRRDPLPDLQPTGRDRDRPGDQFRRSQVDPRSADPDACWDKKSSSGFDRAFSRSPRRAPRSTCFTAVDGWSCSARA